MSTPLPVCPHCGPVMGGLSCARCGHMLDENDIPTTAETSVTVRVNGTGRTVNITITPGVCTFLAFSRHTGALVEVEERTIDE